MTARGEGWPDHLAEYLGYERIESEDGAVRARLQIQPEHIAPPNGFLQATVVIGFADLCCASGTMAQLPDGANFTTIELKTNLLGTARGGAILCEATMQHGGRTTQVWDAVVTNEETGRKIALFRCTQLILYPQKAG